MRWPSRVVASLLPLLLTACPHLPGTHQVSQVQPLAPPIEDAPPPKPVPSPTDLPPTVVTFPTRAPAVEAKAEKQPEEKLKPPAKHRKPAVAAPQQPNAPPPNSQQASNNQQAFNGNPGVPAIGQLSSGNSSNLKWQTNESITTIERGLNGIGRKLSDQEQKTAGQIREFLKLAKAALFSGDVDGAQTLAAKAKVLLGELNQ